MIDNIKLITMIINKDIKNEEINFFAFISFIFLILVDKPMEKNVNKKKNCLKISTCK